MYISNKSVQIFVVWNINYVFRERPSSFRHGGKACLFPSPRAILSSPFPLFFSPSSPFIPSLISPILPLPSLPSHFRHLFPSSPSQSN